MSSSTSFSNQILTDGRLEGFFPGWGGSRVVALNCSEVGDLTVLADTNGPVVENNEKDIHVHKPVGLTTLFSVSIAGCDLMGSCLYTAGVCASNAGKVCSFFHPLRPFFNDFTI